MRNRNQKRPEQRHGVAASELAVCLPVIVLLVLAMIESCTMIFLKQSLTVAAYEGARTALIDGSDPSAVQTTCNGVLADRRVQGGRVTINPPNFDRLAPGQFIEVTVTAPASANSVIPGSFFTGRTLEGRAEFMKEF
ncbi:MAG: pilus assembly protein [Lacipirellulaceae bacterium]